MGLFSLFKNKQSNPKNSSLASKFPPPRSSSITSSSLDDLEHDGELPKYRYVDVPVIYADESFKFLPANLLLGAVYYNGVVDFYYWTENDKDVLVGTLDNQKMTSMIHDWDEKNWQYAAQTSSDGHSINLYFWPC